MYEDLISSLRLCRQILHEDDKCIEFVDGGCESFPVCAYQLMEKAADAIEELLKAAKAMHTWISLNSWNTQAAYDECGLTDEMNMVLGYGGQFAVEMSREMDKGGGNR